MATPMKPQPKLKDRLVPPVGGPGAGGVTSFSPGQGPAWTAKDMMNAKPMGMYDTGGGDPGGGGLFGGGAPGQGVAGGDQGAPAKGQDGKGLFGGSPGSGLFGGLTDPAKTPPLESLVTGGSPGGGNFWDAAHKQLGPAAVAGTNAPVQAPQAPAAIMPPSGGSTPMNPLRGGGGITPPASPPVAMGPRESQTVRPTTQPTSMTPQQRAGRGRMTSPADTRQAQIERYGAERFQRTPAQEAESARQFQIGERDRAESRAMFDANRDPLRSAWYQQLHDRGGFQEGRPTSENALPWEEFATSRGVDPSYYGGRDAYGRAPANPQGTPQRTHPNVPTAASYNPAPPMDNNPPPTEVPQPDLTSFASGDPRSIPNLGPILSSYPNLQNILYEGAPIDWGNLMPRLPDLMRDDPRLGPVVQFLLRRSGLVA